jgi:hypothetical protein
MQRLHIDMFDTEDRDGQIYYMGRIQFPGSLKFEKGAAFLFYPEGDQPELHFCNLLSPDLANVFDYYKQRRTRINRTRHGSLPIEMHKRLEDNPPEGQEPRKFYVGKIQFNGEINCENGVMFMIFIADEGEEELQISIFDPAKSKKYQDKEESFSQNEQY